MQLDLSHLKDQMKPSFGETAGDAFKRSMQGPGRQLERELSRAPLKTAEDDADIRRDKREAVLYATPVISTVATVMIATGIELSVDRYNAKAEQLKSTAYPGCQNTPDSGTFSDGTQPGSYSGTDQQLIEGSRNPELPPPRTSDASHPYPGSGATSSYQPPVPADIKTVRQAVHENLSSENVPAISQPGGLVTKQLDIPAQSTGLIHHDETIQPAGQMQGTRPQSIMEHELEPLRDKQGDVELMHESQMQFSHYDDNGNPVRGGASGSGESGFIANGNSEQIRGINGITSGSAYVETPLDTSVNNIGGNPSLTPKNPAILSDVQKQMIAGSPDIVEQRTVHFTDINGNELEGVFDPNMSAADLKDRLSAASLKTRYEIRNGEFYRTISRDSAMSLETEVIEQHFIANNRLQTKNLDFNTLSGRGWNLIKATDSKGNDIGIVLERTAAGSGTLQKNLGRAIRDNKSTLDSYARVLRGNQTFADKINPLNPFKKTIEEMTRNPVQQEMLRQQKRLYDISKLQKIKGKTIRTLKRSLLNYALQNLSKDEDFNAGYSTNRMVIGGAQAVGRPVLNSFKGAINLAFKKAGYRGGFRDFHKHMAKRLQGSLRSRIGKNILKNARRKHIISKLHGRIHTATLKGILKIIDTQIMMGSFKGVLAAGVWQGITGLGNLTAHAAAKIVSHIPKVGGAKIVTQVLDSVTGATEYLHGYSTAGQLKEAIKGKIKGDIKNATRPLRASLKAFRRGIVNRLNRTAVGRNLVKAGKMIAAPFKAIGTAFKAATELIANLIGFIGHALAIFLIGCVLLLLVGKIEDALLSSLTPFAGLTDIASDKTNDEEYVPSMVTTGGSSEEAQPDVTLLIEYLREDHNDFVDKIEKECSKPNTVRTPVFDNGSDENYRECISALVCMESPNYGNYGKKIVHKALTKVYNKSHIINIVLTEFQRTVVKKDKNGKSYTTTETYYMNVVHVNVLREDEVVDDGQAMAASGDYSNGGDQQVDISDSEWLKICAKVKKAYAQQVGYYSMGHKTTFVIDGKRHNIQTDCVGYVAACLAQAHIVNSWSWYLSSRNWPNGVPFATIHDFHNTSELKKGDILIFTRGSAHHVCVFAGMKNGVVMTYNNGSDKSAGNPGQTSYGNLYTAGLTHFARLNNSQVDKLDKKADKDTSAEKETDTSSSSSGSKSYDGISREKMTWYYLRYKAGLNAQAAAALMGCWKNESGIDPKKYEGYYIKGLPVKSYKDMNSRDRIMAYSDRLIESLIRSGTIKPKQRNNNTSSAYYVPSWGGHICGLGLAQWTGPRAASLISYTNMKWWDFGKQLNFAGKEPRFGKAKKTANKAGSMENAVWIMYTIYEGGTEKGKYYNNRLRDAKTIYKKFKGLSKPSNLDSLLKDIPDDMPSELSSGGGASAYIPIIYDSQGDEVGARTAFTKTLEEYRKSYENGKFEMTTAYGAGDDKYKHLRHVIGEKGGKGTGLDFLRRMYALHGVTLPSTYNGIKTITEEKEKVTRKGSLKWPNIKAGDIILYQIDMKKSFNRPNSLIFAYADGSVVYGFMNEEFTDKNNTTYTKGSVVKIPFSAIKRSHIYGVYRVEKLTCDQLRLAYPYVGFGGFTEEQIHLYDAVKDAYYEEKGEGRQSMWVKETNAMRNDGKVHHYYNGYTEDSLEKKIDLDDLKKTKEDEKKIGQLQYAARYCIGEGILPSVFVTASWVNSGYGKNSLWDARNPVGLKKWWKNDEYDYTVMPGRDQYLQFSSFKDCATAWVQYLNDTNSAKTMTMFKALGSPDYDISDNYKGQFQVGINYYLSFMAGSITDDDESIYAWERICEIYNLYRWDSELTGRDINNKADLTDNASDKNNKEKYDKQHSVDNEQYNSEEHPKTYGDQGSNAGEEYLRVMGLDNVNQYVENGVIYEQTAEDAAQGKQGKKIGEWTRGKECGFPNDNFNVTDFQNSTSYKELVAKYGSKS